MIRITAPAVEVRTFGPEPQLDAVVSIRPDWFDEQRVGGIALRTPEIIYSRSMKDTYYIDHVAGGGFVALREQYVHVPPVWESEEPGRHLRYRVTVPDKCTFWAELTSGDDAVTLTWGFRNETASRIDDLMVQFCPIMNMCAPFVDPAAERVLLHSGGKFVRASDISPQEGTPVLHEKPSHPADDVICLESVDGEHVVGIGWDVRPEHFLNNTALVCIHAEPHIDPLEPDQEREVHGAFYCLEGDRDDLLARFRSDWR